MKLVGIIDEDFVNYKKPAMTLEFPYCSFKCGASLCQNSDLASAPTRTVDPIILAHRYVSNPITEAIVCQGLEPLDSFNELMQFIHEVRCNFQCHDDIVIYTGYTKEECESAGYLTKLKKYDNIIIKYGRFIPDDIPHEDGVLGVKLASQNQYAERIS